MNIVGINISHHSSSCLLRDGKLVYLFEEERICRQKAHQIIYRDLRFYGLEHLKKHVRVIDHLAFSSYGRVGKLMDNVETVFEQFELIDRNGWEYFSDRYMSHGNAIIAKNKEVRFGNIGHSVDGALCWENDRVIIHAVVKQIIDAGIKVKNVIFESDQHHIHHAICGYTFSDFDKASSLVMDAGGSFSLEDYKDISEVMESNNSNKSDKFGCKEVESIYYFGDNEMRSMHQHYDIHYLTLPSTSVYREEVLLKKDQKTFSHTLSAGILFNIITGDQFLGLGCGSDAGKTMGLSSYAELTQKSQKMIIKDSDKKYFPDRILLEDEWFYEVDGVMLTNPKLLDILESSLKSKYDFKVRPDNIYYPSLLAKKLQIETEKLTIFLIKKALEITPTKNVILSGGYFMNCVNNFKYRKYFSDDIKFFIDPIPYEAGTCFGCAAQVWMGFTGKKVKVPDNLYLGS